MDLRLNAATARNAVIWILNCIGAVLLLWATSSHGSTQAASRDYLFTSEANGGHIEYAAHTQSSRSHSKQTQPATYQSFAGQSFELEEHRGVYVNVLLPQSVDEGLFFTSDHIEELVDRLDLLYVLYRELLQVEPAGQGLLNIAFVGQTCGMGCGLLGSRGIEILSHPLNYENIIRELDAGRLEKILVHEMVHNFDTFSKYLHYLPDHAHAWTDMFEFFAPYRYARGTLNNEAPDDVYNSPVSSVWKSYVTDESASWESCVRDQACEDAGLPANHLWAMLYYRIESMHGVEALLDSFQFIQEYASSSTPPESEAEKEGLRILSLAVGVGANIACYMDALKWPVTDSVRNELKQRFGNGSSFCADFDRDGFSAINGDCDDQDSGRNILSNEIPGNGIDDDCDELVDEEHLVEAGQGDDPDNFPATVQARLPFQVDGSASDSEDTDGFRFPLSGTRRARVTLCAADKFRGWAVALQPDGSFLKAANWNTYQPAAGCSSNTFDYGDYKDGGLLVMPDEAPGSYTLTVSEASELPADHSIYLSAAPRPYGGTTLWLDDRDGLLAALGADEIEFWVSGVGLQLFRPYSPELKVQLTSSNAPQLAGSGLYQVRMRPRASGKPLAAFSAGHLFRHDSGPAAVPVLDSGFSGLWYDPEHDGEGFIVEILENERALVYWFTYHSDGRQRWFIGVGEVNSNRIQIDKLLDTRGGRFGAEFDPDDVIRKDRGSLSISFNSCSQAQANFSVDNNGGNLPLQRLTSVYGHGCGKADTLPAMDFSGSWYDPSHDGEGFTIEQIDDRQAIAFYFTYDASGNQAWLFNTGSIAGNRISFPDLLQPVGGEFGRSYDPETVRLLNWGELELELDCDRGPASYASAVEGFSNGSQNLVRLTRLQNSGCGR